ncbi:hypothetical protein [Dactylosporangium sp. CA-233914]|uniref:hypothetical protein n=1 Tax=Dactylosporangium sp. CA-233914 TaxID=3239934 RepID=UPI003D9288FD
MAVGLTVYGFGSYEAVTPAATDTGSTTVQFWRLLAVGSGVLPVLTLAGSMTDLEAIGGRSYHRLRALVLGVAFVGSSACFLAAVAAGVGTSAMWQTARALIAWFGIALVSGRVLGFTYAWLLPFATLCAMLYWGFDSDAGQYRWWEFTAQPAGHPASGILAIVLLVVGLAMFTSSPWRVYRLARFWALRRRTGSGVDR